MKYVAASALVLFGLAACAGPGGVAPDRGLMYEMPETPTVVYEMESSQDISVDIPSMGAMEMVGTSEATMAMTFTEVEGGLQVTANFQTLTASMNNPMAGAITASESDVTKYLPCYGMIGRNRLQISPFELRVQREARFPDPHGRGRADVAAKQLAL